METFSRDDLPNIVAPNVEPMGLPLDGGAYENGHVSPNGGLTAEQIFNDGTASIAARLASLDLSEQRPRQ
jgi:hypothetical protein